MLIRYVLAGLFNTCVAFVVYYASVRWLMAPAWLGNLAGMVMSILSGFLLSKYFVFNHGARTSYQIVLKYLLTYGAQYVVGTSVIYVFMRLGLSAIEAYIVAVPCMVAVSFFLQRYWVFSSRQDAS
ncbi:MAG: GtrA family protein [Alphaproteobacteria bacterium]|nr:GtrA family protein [Alphaproteobacteria bacterium]MBU2082846.1 GtrA family protein [Alphaproteobacteria bacterium]MBU2142970.1 GtrA family protein [Alphaproteobacteria bacterium]MBU2196564.1 GtrA family protein [Alphaproteobacteria bacterium]